MVPRWDWRVFLRHLPPSQKHEIEWVTGIVELGAAQTLTSEVRLGEPTDDLAAGVVSPVRYGRHVLCRPLAPGDEAWLYSTVAMTTVGAHWRLHGVIPPPQELFGMVLGASELNYMLCGLDGEPFGFAQLLSVDRQSGRAYLSAFFHPDVQGRGWPMEGIVAYLDYAFTTLGLHKIYLESTVPAADQYGSAAAAILELEGTLKGHQVQFNRRLDTLVYAAYPDKCAAVAERILPTSLLAQSDLATEPIR